MFVPYDISSAVIAIYICALLYKLNFSAIAFSEMCFDCKKTKKKKKTGF